jgi:hypothetical protein
MEVVAGEEKYVLMYQVYILVLKYVLRQVMCSWGWEGCLGHNGSDVALA